LERLYDAKLHPENGSLPLAPKTVLEIHLIIRVPSTMPSGVGS
jgi:hypothetical protein